MIFSSPAPQFGQCCMSMLKTRSSNRAQLMRCGRAAWRSVLKGKFVLSGPFSALVDDYIVKNPSTRP